MADTISTVFDPYVEDAPDHNNQPTEDFDNNATYFASYLTSFVTKLTSLIPEINTLANSVEADALNAENAKILVNAAANFKGEWSGLGTAALTVPSSVYHSGSFWMLLTDVANVSLEEPTLANTNWTEIEFETLPAQATLAEMEAGTETGVRMLSPLNVSQAIQASTTGNAIVSMGLVTTSPKVFNFGEFTRFELTLGTDVTFDFTQLDAAKAIGSAGVIVCAIADPPAGVLHSEGSVKK